MPEIISSSSPADNTCSKPPSVFRYALILLKARPSVSDIDTISVYSERCGPRLISAVQTNLEARFSLLEERVGERLETPPPPYEP
jgi:hypothetical protein